MAMQYCARCGATCKGNLCDAHRAHRGTTAERGYGSAHRAARAHLASQLPAMCAYGCGTILEPGSDWVAAHIVDGDPTAGWQASCRRCNERAKIRSPR